MKPWMKFAILGSTYARALQNAGQRAGRSFAPDAFSHIAAQPQATLKPGLSSFVREPGVLPPTPQSTAMQDLAHKMPWAGDEHAHPAQAATAVGDLNHLLKQRGLDHNTPAGQPTTHQRIEQSFGNPDEFRRQLYRQDMPAAPVEAGTAARSPRAMRQAPAVSPSASTSVLGRGPSNTMAGNAGANAMRPSAPAPRPKFPTLSPVPHTKVGALPTAVGLGIPLAVGGGLLASKPGIQSNLKNLMSGKGSTQEQDTTNEIPEQALGHADAIHQALTAHGLDPATLRMGIDAPPGSGKTTLARALAQRTGMKHHGLDWEPGNWWKSTVGLGRNIEKTPHAPHAGEILEHYMLGRTHDPELFDAMVHIHRDPETIRQQLRSRGNAAYISDMMDLDKSLGVADLGFNTLGGDMIDLGNGVQMKLRPREGWGDALDQRLMAGGIDPTGMSRHEKLLSLHAGKKETGAGWTPYVKNPLSTGETLALGASVPLGMMAARALRARPR